MPVISCKAGGKKYGKSGKCYSGKSAASKAKRQGRAIEASKARCKK